MHVKAHLHTTSSVSEEQVDALRRIVEQLSCEPDHVLVYPWDGIGGGVMTEFQVKEASQAVLIDVLGEALRVAIPGVYDLGLAFRE